MAKKKYLNLQETEALLRANMEAAKALGWTVAREVTIGEEDKTTCAIGAWGVANGLLLESYEDLAERIGIAPRKAEDFVSGFDFSAYVCHCGTCGDPKEQERISMVESRDDTTHPKWFDLGRKLAKEFIEEPSKDDE